ELRIRLSELRHPPVETVGARAPDDVIELGDRLFLLAESSERRREVITGLNACRRIRICVGRGAQLWYCGVQLLRLRGESPLGTDPCRCRRIARLCLRVHGHHGGVEHDRRLCEQLRPPCLLAVAIREQSEHGDPNEDDGDYGPGELPAVCLEKFPCGGHHLGDVVLFELSAMLGLHVTRCGWC